MIGKLPSVEVLEMLFEYDAERGALHWKARPATKSNSGYEGRRFYLGEHTSLDGAAEVVMAKRAALHGAFARA